MHPNKAVLEQFYTGFQEKDFRKMQACYGDQARFSDPVFRNLDAGQVKAMWEMLITRGKDLQVTVVDIQASDSEGSAKWIAKYSFSATRRSVENHVTSSFRFLDGKILEQTDEFNFYSWSRQALGLPGILLGWSSLLQSSVQKKARKSLDSFIQRKN